MLSAYLYDACTKPVWSNVVLLACNRLVETLHCPIHCIILISAHHAKMLSN